MLGVYDIHFPLARYVWQLIKHTIKPILPYFLSQRHSCEKKYQDLSRFSVPQAMESWVGPGNEASK